MQGGARGDERLRAQTIGSLARLEWFAGNLQLALDQAALSQELHRQSAHGHEVGFAGRLKALAEADLGLVEEARASATEALAQSESLSDREWAILTLGVLGRIELALGDVGAALGYLRELPGQLLSTGYGDPVTAVWADAIEALIAGGELDRARSYLEAYEANASRAGSPGGLRPLPAAAACMQPARATSPAPSRRSTEPWPSWTGSPTRSSALVPCSVSASYAGRPSRRKLPARPSSRRSRPSKSVVQGSGPRRPAPSSGGSAVAPPRQTS